MDGVMQIKTMIDQICCIGKCAIWNAV